MANVSRGQDSFSLTETEEVVFNIWSLSSLFLAFDSLRGRRRMPGEREEGKKEGDASKPQANLLPLSQVWSLGKTIIFKSRYKA